ncbi:chromosome partitioning ATPase [Klebsiella pneumoniae subsp. ozaenae]|uniref:Chromosome partitioning ATPase n=1 Tax=Klebsiella pneumoniae subsp. ozaenae TaxID=574 RepID=A0A377Z355_KLEPO|nr:chromosome partitioning ATPase [Klebsiella pneumoniae subsp. ozaenae]
MENVVTKTLHKARVVPVISTKGGEGKSTQSANLSGFLADAGKKVLLIDGDHSQPTASSIFSLEYEAPNGLYELLMKTVDLAQADQIISRSVINNLDIIVSNDPHDRLSSAMLHAPDGRMRLRNVLQHPLFQKLRRHHHRLQRRSVHHAGAYPIGQLLIRRWCH